MHPKGVQEMQEIIVDAPIPVLTDRKNSRKLERKGVKNNGTEEGKKGDAATAVR